MSYPYKYTDRDVRENDEYMRSIVQSYLVAYEGGFQFLVDCKMRILVAEQDLTVGMVKGVLNCMRVDPRLPTGVLPEPLPPEEAVVIQMPKKKKDKPKKKHTWGPDKCDREEFHGPHQIGDDHDTEYSFYYSCGGKYAINRQPFNLPARLNVPFVTSRTGERIHKHNGEAWFTWSVPPHEYGWGWWYLSDCPVRLSVRTLCLFPRVIENAILLADEHMDEALETPVTPRKDPRVKCHRCFEGE